MFCFNSMFCFNGSCTRSSAGARPARLVVPLAAVLGLLAPVCLAPVHANPPGGTSGWTQTFDDEFSGGSLDTNSKWTPGWSWSYGDGAIAGTHDNRESNHNFGGYPTYNLSVNNGLTIRSAQESYQDDKGNWHDFTSGALSTDGKFAQKYGYFEANIQIASTQGLDSAFWMLPSNHNNYMLETDILEVASGKNWARDNGDGTYTPGTIALLSAPGGSHSNYSLPDGSAFSANYHTYGIDWEPNSITYYVDGQIAKQVDSTNATIPAEPMFMLLNNELEQDTLEGRNNGDWVGDPYAGSYPQYMHVAWVHAWQKNAPGSAAPVGHRIGLKAGANGKYASANLNNSSFLEASWADSVYGWETFDVVDAGGGNVGLKSEATGKFVTVDFNQSSRILRADWADSINSWESFQWVDQGNGSFGLKSNVNGLFVSCNLGDGNHLEAQWAQSVGDWERFTYTDLGTY